MKLFVPPNRILLRLINGTTKVLEDIMMTEGVCTVWSCVVMNSLQGPQPAGAAAQQNDKTHCMTVYNWEYYISARK
jgi:hypothetical protein